MRDVVPYSVLAAGYDVVMEHVDYDSWAAYIHGILLDTIPEATTVLELGCGTGSFALALERIAKYRYAATDRALPMIRVARAKAQMYGADIQFSEADFTDFRLDRTVDAALLLYDGLNYVLEDDGVAALFACVYAAVAPGGVFVFDQSTPANSINNEALFEDTGSAQGFSYKRSSWYDAEAGLHTNVFEIEALGKSFREEHVQRAYDMEYVRAAAEAAGFVVEHAYDEFTNDPADQTSERIHWVVRRPIH